MNPFLITDGYKTGHHKMYPEGTTKVYSNFTPRHGKHTNVKGGIGVISFGQQMVMRQIQEMFDEHFFMKNLIQQEHDRIVDNPLTGDSALYDEIGLNFKDKVCGEIKKEYSMYLDTDYDVSHIEALWDLGYLPLEVKVLPEGTFVPYGVPVLTIVNTKPEFFWLTNFLETLISNMLWMPMTAATTAYHYKTILLNAAQETDEKNIPFVDFQGHNFGMRGMAGIDATMYAGLGHATSFKGDDSLPTIACARKYYDETGFVVGSVNATEHSVMCAGTKGDEIGTFRYLMKQFPTGILSIVSDTWDLWKVITEYLPTMKEEILARDGKIVIRPDSGDPVDIICGYTIMDRIELEEYIYSDDYKWSVDHIAMIGEDGNYYKAFQQTYPDGSVADFGLDHSEKLNLSETKGVIELLWDLFGGTTNEQGYKILDPHIGAIYGDSITPARAKEICKRLEAKGFASTNIVLGIGSFTYQFVTRDTHGFAMKATYCEVKVNTCEDCASNEECLCVEGREIFKDPITGDGSKKSAKGLLHVGDFGDKGYILSDQVDYDSEKTGALKTIFKDGEFYNKTTLTKIREKLNK